MNKCTEPPVVLHDVALGWKDDCRGLTANQDANTTAACKAACEKDSSCAVWQFHESKCYTGVPTQACRTRGDFKADAGQRLQHGIITNVKPAVGMEVMSLRAFAMQSGDAAMDAKRCKLQCYSDVTCGVWQFGGQTATGKGCWTETAGHERGETKTDTDYAKAVEFGEFVEHKCPPPIKEEEDNTWLY